MATNSAIVKLSTYIERENSTDTLRTVLQPHFSDSTAAMGCP